VFRSPSTHTAAAKNILEETWQQTIKTELNCHKEAELILSQGGRTTHRRSQINPPDLEEERMSEWKSEGEGFIFIVLG
jgi:hypothetical protein